MPSRLTLGHGGSWSSTLDLDGRMTRYTLAGAAVNLSWDAGDRLVNLEHTGDASLSTRGTAAEPAIGYDALDRLIGYRTAARTQSFSYDASGNRLSKSDQSGPLAAVVWTSRIASGSNRLEGMSAPVAESWTWDAAGHLQARPGLSAEHDARGRLTAVTLGTGAGAETVRYTYNGLGQRTSKRGPAGRVAGGGVVFVHDESGRLLGEYDLQGRAVSEIVWLGDRPVGVWQGRYAGTAGEPSDSVVLYAEADHLGAPRRLADGLNRSRWVWNPAPFGDTLAQDNPAGLGAVTFNLRLPGQYFDAETNLHQNWHRDYDPATGRYVQSDPIGLAGGINTYAYVENNPLSYTDPEGLVKLHGNWCGPNWSGGFTKPYDRLSDAERGAALPPVTRLDGCCQTHDLVYAECRRAHPCDAAARQKCFERADRDLSSCASRSGSGYGANLLLFGNPQRRIQNYMRDSSPAAEENAKECSCTK